MWNKASPSFLGCSSDFQKADTILFGAPFDSTASYRPGARFGSRAVREESFGIETYSPYQDADLSECAVLDAGDLELCIGDSKSALSQIKKFSAAVYRAGKLPLMIGGEHLVTLGSVSEAAERFPDLRVLQFDAHCDLRDEYLGARLSHATVLRRCWDLLGDGRIYQFGIRSGLREEFRWSRAHTSLSRFGFDGLRKTIQEIHGYPVYLTVDLDVLDPSVFPGTGTPEPGGVTFRELMDAVLSVAGNCRLVGCDLVELAPALDLSGVSTITVCKLLRELLLALNRNPNCLGKTGKKNTSEKTSEN